MNVPSAIEAQQSRSTLSVELPTSSKRPCTGSNRPILCLLSLGLLSCLLSLTIVPLITHLLTTTINEQLVVDGTGSPEYDTWVSNTDPETGLGVTYDIYLFHVANHEAVVSSGEKPELVEVGPYRYAEYFNRFNVEFSADKNEVEFWEQWYYVFDEVGSHPLNDVTDRVVQNNLVLNGLKQLLIDNDELLTEAVVGMINNSTKIPKFEKSSLLDKIAAVDLADLGTKAAVCLTKGKAGLADGQFHTRSPVDLYFGYDNDPTLAAIGTVLAEYAPALATNWSTASGALVGANSTSEEAELLSGNSHTTYTGHDDIKNLGKYKYYSNMTHQYVCPAAASNCPDTPSVPCYDEVCYCHKFQWEWGEEEAYCHGWLSMFKTQEATVIMGTDATQTGEFPMGDYLQVFISDLYRSSQLKFEGTQDDWHGVKLRRYGIDDRDLESADVNASQADFFQFGVQGMENMSVAAGFPLFATKPHFLDGDDSLLTGVVGMNPNKEHHDTYVDFEPITGVAMRVAKRLQVATEFTAWDMPTFSIGTVIKEALKLEGLQELVDVLNCLEEEVTVANVGSGNKTYIPYSWADEYYEFSEDDATEFKEQVYGTQDLAENIKIWAYVGCGVAGVGALVMVVFRKGVRKEMLEEYGKLIEMGGSEGDSMGDRWTRIGGQGRGEEMKF